MRILVLNYEYPPLGGGASPVCHEINKRYVNNGHRVEVVTMHFKGLPIEEIVDGVHIFRVKCWRSKKHICHPWEQLSFVLKAKNVIRKRMEKTSFDVCHTHFIIPTGLLSKWCKKEYGIPYVITAHGSDVPGFNPDRFKLLHQITPRIIQPILAHSSAIVSPSNYLSRLIRNVQGPVNTRIEIIPNGIDKNTFVPQKKEPIILSTGRLLERKGFQYLIEAVSQLNSAFEVHICGDGPMMPRLKELASKSKTKIHLHGWVDNRGDFYKELLGKASIYTLISTNENASISLLEGMSAGCLVMTSNTSGCPETVGDAGVCIEPENAGALNEQLSYYIDRPDEMIKKGALSRVRIESQLDWGVIYKKYEDLLLNVQSIANS